MESQTPSPALAELVLTAQQSAVEYAEALPPDGEWSPAMFVETLRGEHIFLEGFGFANEEERGVLFGEVIPALMRGLHAARAALVVPGYAVTLKVKSPDFERERAIVGLLTPAHHPDHEEVLIVHGLEGKTRVVSMAVVQRTPDAAPTLGKWRNSATLGGGK